MLKWSRRKIGEMMDWVISKSPPVFRKLEKDYTKTFWTVIFLLWVIPFGLTVYAGLSAVIWGLTWAASVRLW
jgi:hypothetical protein